MLLSVRFSEVVQNEEFLNLTSAHVCQLICSDQLTVTSEEQVGIVTVTT